MPFDIVENLKRLVEIPSEARYEKNKVIRQNYREAAEAVAEMAKSHGLNVEQIDLLNGEIPTLIITLPEAPQNKPTMAFVSHYDVVPAKGPWIVDGEEIDPYKPVVKDGKMYGRGAADDKSAIVASIGALVDLLEEKAELKYNPVVVVTGDEEVGGTGIKLLLEKGYRWDRVVIVDAGSEYVSIGASGVVEGWIKVKGKAGHAGYPHTTRNAAEDLVRLLNEFFVYKSSRFAKLSKLPSPPGSPIPYVWGRFTVNILKLPETEAEKHNRVPGEAWAGFDMRLLPEEDVEEAINELYSFLSSAVARLGINGNLEVVAKQKGWYAKNEEFINEAVLAAKKAYKRAGLEGEPGVAAELGGNDGSHFDAYGMDVLAFGTIRFGTNIHAQGEFVYLEDVEMGRYFIYEIVKKE